MVIHKVIMLLYMDIVIFTKPDSVLNSSSFCLMLIKSYFNNFTFELYSILGIHMNSAKKVWSVYQLTQKQGMFSWMHEIIRNVVICAYATQSYFNICCRMINFLPFCYGKTEFIIV